MSESSYFMLRFLASEILKISVRYDNPSCEVAIGKYALSKRGYFWEVTDCDGNVLMGYEKRESSLSYMVKLAVRDAIMEARIPMETGN